MDIIRHKHGDWYVRDFTRNETEGFFGYIAKHDVYITKRRMSVKLSNHYCKEDQLTLREYMQMLKARGAK